MLSLQACCGGRVVGRFVGGWLLRVELFARSMMGWMYVHVAKTNVQLYFRLFLPFPSLAFRLHSRATMHTHYADPRVSEPFWGLALSIHRARMPLSLRSRRSGLDKHSNRGRVMTCFSRPSARYGGRADESSGFDCPHEACFRARVSWVLVRNACFPARWHRVHRPPSIPDPFRSPLPCNALSTWFCERLSLCLPAKDAGAVLHLVPARPRESACDEAIGA